MTLADLPTDVNVADSFWANYWAGELGVSTGALIQAVNLVGTTVKKVRKYLKAGKRIAIIDENGQERLVARIGFMNDGLHVSVPYHQARNGLLFKTPFDYSKKEDLVPCQNMERFVVSDRAKLSIHQSGFVQFSTLEKKIISGYNPALEQIKGMGVRAPAEVKVNTGPLFGVIVQGIEDFDINSGKHCETFTTDQFWHHPDFSTVSDTAINLEFFMMSREDTRRATLNPENQRTRKLHLPFNGEFKFPFDVRMIEIPHSPFDIGLIVSRVSSDDNIESGYKIGGPGCFDEDGNAFGITAWYPCPDIFDGEDLPSLDYKEG
ncbi:hypothetical protein RBSH_02952 [Rhodopirellula baltica SH28]|uniref:Uncharacterized protein n=1 Tax=Rhodopirellula baltica SH28 TaxID=993517 RepID=K5DH61_RHOBT|nr:DUF3606 domain-containing protein [Rhodopirellula baltica]EKK01748.1 hypothetical protein RBSH_02952 [Rhodopirellula baltica SH28]